MKSKIVLIVLFLLAAILLSSCGGPGAAGNVFDAREIEAGDQVAGLTVEDVQVYPGFDPEDEDNYLATVKFSGRITISGKFISYEDQPLLGRSILFYPDEASRDLIPRLPHDAGEAWFQFENYQAAAGLLGGPGSEGEATVIIDSYTINYSMEVVHTADIIEVVEK